MSDWSLIGKVTVNKAVALLNSTCGETAGPMEELPANLLVKVKGHGEGSVSC